jgi:hypothetical protein
LSVCDALAPPPFIMLIIDAMSGRPPPLTSIPLAVLTSIQYVAIGGVLAAAGAVFLAGAA